MKDWQFWLLWIMLALPIWIGNFETCRVGGALNPENIQSRVFYVRDPRTNICFALLRVSPSETQVPVVVPCEKLPVEVPAPDTAKTLPAIR